MNELTEYWHCDKCGVMLFRVMGVCPVCAGGDA